MTRRRNYSSVASGSALNSKKAETGAWTVASTIHFAGWEVRIQPRARRSFFGHKDLESGEVLLFSQVIVGVPRMYSPIQALH